MTRDIIKLFAVLAMTVNHTALALLSKSNNLYAIMIDIGYFTAITMCYFLVEGYYHTHSKSAYMKRLILFGIVSQIPYTLALEIYQFDMMFTLAICLLILIVIDCQKTVEFKIIIVSFLIAITIYCDWSVQAPAFTVLFRLTYKQDKIRIAYIISFLLHFAFSMYGYYKTNDSLNGAIIYSFGASIGIAVSGLVILKLYNGKKSEKFGTFWKWLFYSYYPIHLCVLCILKQIITK